jgi:hypothetical protein
MAATLNREQQPAPTCLGARSDTTLDLQPPPRNLIPVRQILENPDYVCTCRLKVVTGCGNICINPAFHESGYSTANNFMGPYSIGSEESNGQIPR